MYKSPIEVYVNNMLNQIRQREENQIVAEVSQAVGLNVEKEELIKALNYDRNQYYKGYEDGKRANKWIPVSERLPKLPKNRWDNFLVTEIVHTLNGDVIEVDIEAFFNGKFQSNTEVIAWMPLPRPYIESEDKENDSN